MCVGLVVFCPADGIVSYVLLTPGRLVCLSALFCKTMNTTDNFIQNNISTALKQPVSLGSISSGMFSSRSDQPFGFLVTCHDFSFAFWTLCGHNWEQQWLLPRRTRQSRWKWGQVAGSWKTHLFLELSACFEMFLTSKLPVPRPKRSGAF